jgi:hypothetical protein
MDKAIKFMIDQLEFEEKEKSLAKLKQENKFYRDLKILKVEILEITGKEKKRNP